MGASESTDRSERIKCNVDGSVQIGSAGCGGVFRDAGGAWILGFSRNLSNLDHCDIMESELWGIITGLTIASEEGFSNVLVVADSSSSVNMVLKGCKENHPYYDLIQKTRSLMERSLNVEIVHVNREKNKLADWMADHSHKLQAGSQKKFIIPPDEIKNLLENERNSKASKILAVGAAIGAVAIGGGLAYYALSSSSTSTSESPNHDVQPFSSSSSSSSGSFPGNHQETKKQILIKCNVDGSVRNGKGGCGGVFRDASSGVWIHGFSLNLGQCDDVVESELLGIITGLTIAWKKGFGSVIVETDNSPSVNLIKNGCEQKHRHHHLIEQVKTLKKHPWNDLDIVYVSREDNKAADRMANYSHQLNEGKLSEFSDPPAWIGKLA